MNTRHPILKGFAHWLPPVLALFLSSMVPRPGEAGEVLDARVIAVVNGDTFLVQAMGAQEAIRLAGIDAPEDAQPYSYGARWNLRRLVLGKDVRIEWTRRDGRGRIVGKVWASPPGSCPEGQLDCPKTVDVALDQLKAGLAWHYDPPVSEVSEIDYVRYSSAQQEAKVGATGLWKGPDPVPPWEYRLGHGQPAEPGADEDAQLVGLFETELAQMFAKVAVYPTKARRYGYQGLVVVRLEFDASGKHIDSAVLHSSGYDLLDAAALEAVKRASPLPVMPAAALEKLARAKNKYATVPFNFQLREPELPSPKPGTAP
jgi:TonB family protein